MLQSAFKPFFVLFLLHLSSSVFAFKYIALYSAGCERSIGILINVDRESIELLTLKGEIQKKKIIDINFLAEYAFDRIIPKQMKNGNHLNQYKIFITVNKKEQLLVDGLLVDGTEKKLSFLDISDAREIIVDNTAITRIEKQQSSRILNFHNDDQEQIRFQHYDQYNQCPYIDKNTGSEIIFPQKTLDDQVEIKKYFTAFEKLKERMTLLDDEQIFYAKPYYFKNIRKFGVWYNTPSRYTTNSKRTNSFQLTIYNELSDLPFGYQQAITVGPAPLFYTPYSSPQQQVTYEMKSSCFGLNLFYDLDLSLLGSYTHAPNDFTLSVDDTLSQTHNIGTYVFYNKYKLSFAAAGYQISVKENDQFKKLNSAQFTYGIHYEDVNHQIDIYRGESKAKEKISQKDLMELQATGDALRALLKSLPEKQYKTGYTRINYFNLQNGKHKRGVSLIQRETQFGYAQNLINTEHKLSDDPFVYQSRSQIIAFFYDYQILPVFSMQYYFAYENLNTNYGYKRLGFDKNEVAIESKKTSNFTHFGLALFFGF